MKAVMYGAGAIGRGFIGQKFYLSGYDTTFIDVNHRAERNACGYASLRCGIRGYGGIRTRFIL